MELPSKLFIGGLSAQTTTDMLREHFAKYGRVIDSVVMQKQGRPRGFGFVTFEAASCAIVALAEPQWLGDRFVDVKRAVPGEQPVEQLRRLSKIFVGGLPQDATTEDLRALFTAYGPIADAVVMVDRRTKRSRGFGFIRFTSSTQGAQASDAVLADAAKHCLAGKWIEVKRATPAAALQDFSPSCGAEFSPASTASTACTPSYRQPQMQWLGGMTSPSMSSMPSMSATPTSQDRLVRAHLSNAFNEVADGCGMYSPHWAAPHGGAFLDWEMGMFSPMRHFPAEMSGFSPAAAMYEASFHMEAEMTNTMAKAEAQRSERNGSRSCRSDSDEENRASAATRAVTPPPTRSAKKPALGVLASPMRIEFPSRSFEELATEDKLSDLGLLESFAKVKPALSAC